MNPLELTQAIREVLSAQSEQELASILARNPALLEQETLENLMAMAQQAKQDGEDEVSETLQMAIVRIATFQSQSSQQIPSIEPKVAWAIKARRCLALRKREFLTEAIAEVQGQTEIVTFLQAFADGNYSEVDRLADQLIQKLQQSERHEEALTINLLYLDTRAGLAERYINYPFEQQKQARELGIQVCQQAIQIAQILNDNPCQAFYSGVLASGFQNSRQLREAEHFYIQALRLYRALAEEDPRIFNQFVAITLNNLGNVERNMRKLADAEKSYAEALQIRRALAKQEPHIFNQDVAETLNGLGIVQGNMRKLADAENSYAEALQIRRALAKQEPHIFNQDVAKTLNGLGIVQGNMRKLADAENSYAEALQFYRDLAKQEPHIFNQNVAKTLNNLGIVQRDLRKLADAENSYAEALQLFRDLAKQKPHIFNQNVAGVLNNLGLVQSDIKKMAEAEKSYAEALQLFQDLAKQEPHIFNQDVAKTLNNLGIVQRGLRKLADAENSFVEALRLYQVLANQEPHIFNQNVAMTLNGLGNAQNGMRKLADAEHSFAEALRLYRDLAKQEPYIFNGDVATTLNNLGNVQIYLNKFVEAEKSFTESLQIRRALAKQEPHIFNQDVAMTLLNLGTLQSGLRKLAEAENSLVGALQLYRKLAEPEPHIFNQDVARTLNNLGCSQLDQDKLDEARENFESARSLIEDLRTGAITIDDRNRILQEMSPIYSNLLACYIRMKDWKKALEIAELGKSRSLSDLLNLKSEDLQPKASTSDTLAIVKDLGRKYSDAIKELQQIESHERYLSEQLNRFENDIRRIKDDDENDDDTRQSSLRQIAEQKQPLEEEKQKVQNQRFAKQDELKSVLEEIGKYDNDFPPKAKDIDVESIFAISEKQNRTIVMFRILRESTAIIFVFPTGELHIKEIKGFGQRKMFEFFHDNWLLPYLRWKNREIGIDEWKAAIEKTLNALCRRLIIHVYKILKEKSDSKEVLFVPNQSLALLPLHAASWKDEAGKKHYLLEEYSISYAPSVSVFKRCQENEKLRSNKTLFVTNPKEDLDSSEKEVSFIERLHQPSKNLLRKDATKSAVIEALREDYGFTHFSCHGFYNQVNPFDSGLVMSDEAIKLSEIISTNLQNNWLTTLSACETGMVDFASPTDEHFGLPLGFIFAGSPSVWASLWSVSDMATSELMQMAYENLSQEEYKNNKPEALRQAQLSMLNDRDSAHPFFWAGFQHFGV